MNTNGLKMFTPDDLSRRTCLKGISLGAGAVVLQPFVNALAAEAAGEKPPLRVIFFMQGNGLWPQRRGQKGGARLDTNYYRVSPAEDPPGPEKGSMRVSRGGGWDSVPLNLRSADRNGYKDDQRYDDHRFRVVLDVRPGIKN